jgi:hypothetical protein
MNVNILANLMSSISLETINDEDTYLLNILDAINEAAQVCVNAVVYELITLNNNSIKNIGNKIKNAFPDIDVTIKEKRIYIDWS